MHHAQTFIYDQHESASNVPIGSGYTNKAQSVVLGRPIEKQGSNTTQASSASQAYKGTGATSITKKDSSGQPSSRHQQISLRHSQKRTVIKQTNHTGIVDHTQGGISSQGINWLGSMGTQVLIVDALEHDFWRLLTQKTLNTKYLTS